MFPWRCLHQKCSDIVAVGQYRSSGPRVRARTHPANASGWNIETVCLHLCAQLSAFWSSSRRHRLLSAAVKPDNENTTKWQQTKPSNYCRFTSLHYQHTHIHTHTARAQPCGCSMKTTQDLNLQLPGFRLKEHWLWAEKSWGTIVKGNKQHCWMDADRWIDKMLVSPWCKAPGFRKLPIVSCHTIVHCPLSTVHCPLSTLGQERNQKLCRSVWDDRCRLLEDITCNVAYFQLLFIPWKDETSFFSQFGNHVIKNGPRPEASPLRAPALVWLLRWIKARCQ